MLLDEKEIYITDKELHEKGVMKRNNINKIWINAKVYKIIRADKAGYICREILIDD